MSPRSVYPDGYELVSRSSSYSEGTYNLDDGDFEAQAPRVSRLGRRRTTWLQQLFPTVFAGPPRRQPRSRRVVATHLRPPCLPRFYLRRRFFYYIHVFWGIILALLILTAIFNPSYSRPPPHYTTLRSLAQRTNKAGRGNPRNEKVFIAASLYDRSGELAGGGWATQLLQLIDMLGDDNVFVSIYENDSGAEGVSALRGFEKQLTCRKSIIFEEHLDPQSLSTVIVPGGDNRVKRIEYLAQVRNKALEPLEADPDVRYDKLLYLNDIMFDPIDALQLLFSTNVDTDGRAKYRAACAVDFDNPFKFYDTYATRDLQGYSMGLPFYPWFTTAGGGESRRDVQAGKDAVRVRSCWGGMVAFDAKYFQSPLPESFSPARFRSASDLFWDSSECCLIHADIQDHPIKVDDIVDTGIYMNPFIRVAYDSRTLFWLGITKRFEKLYSTIHNIGNHLVGMPWDNPRRTEVPGQSVPETVWIADDRQNGGGSFQVIHRIAGHDGFCGRPGLQVIVENRLPGQKGFEPIPAPPLP
ncbi:hypothetical protein N7478_006014 [Penicillium angulare]|uniref:uncharacterized protein n=1 Tax=Penicillium angulare TaxID=116970 RepID=UPI002541694E|nr:uncharacterized protein N7478_006014 [Penicillium angulare]KAJ5280642.1 hypothetical protein N7478_006014 [Penicillium angulare]